MVYFAAASGERKVSTCGIQIVLAPPQAFDVSWFYGDPSRARALLGWTASVLARCLVLGMTDEAVFKTKLRQKIVLA